MTILQSPILDTKLNELEPVYKSLFTCKVRPPFNIMNKYSKYLEAFGIKDSLEDYVLSLSIKLLPETKLHNVAIVFGVNSKANLMLPEAILYDWFMSGLNGSIDIYQNDRAGIIIKTVKFDAPISNIENYMNLDYSDNDISTTCIVFEGLSRYDITIDYIIED